VKARVPEETQILVFAQQAVREDGLRMRPDVDVSSVILRADSDFRTRRVRGGSSDEKSCRKQNGEFKYSHLYVLRKPRGRFQLQFG
jgi:hypothetical protein